MAAHRSVSARDRRKAGNEEPHATAQRRRPVADFSGSDAEELRATCPEALLELGRLGGNRSVARLVESGTSRATDEAQRRFLQPEDDPAAWVKESTKRHLGLIKKARSAELQRIDAAVDAWTAAARDGDLAKMQSAIDTLLAAIKRWKATKVDKQGEVSSSRAEEVAALKNEAIGKRYEIALEQSAAQGGGTPTTKVKPPVPKSKPKPPVPTSKPKPPKPKPSIPKSPKVSLKTTLEKVLAGAVTLDKLQAAYSPYSFAARQAVTSDSTLMGKIKTALSTKEWLRVIADLGVYAPDGTVAHTKAKKADQVIRKEFKDYVGEAVKAGRSVAGRVVVLDGQAWIDAYYHEFPNELPQGGSTDEEPQANAFTTTKEPKNVIVLHKDRGNPGTGVHEGLHLYQDDKVLNTCGYEFNEALTEYFTRKLTIPMNISRANYQANYKVAVELKNAVGDKVLRKAYFNGSVAALKAAFVKFRKGKGDSATKAATNWTRLLTRMRTKKFDDAKKLCK